MKQELTRLVFVAVAAALTVDARAEVLQLVAGASCRPATAADVANLDYRNGAAVNVHPAPGTSAQNARVTCALPPVPPNHFVTRISIAYVDVDRRWSKCYFHDLYPTAPRAVMTATVPGSLHLGQAVLTVAPGDPMPAAATCTVRPGQTLYGVELALEPY